MQFTKTGPDVPEPLLDEHEDGNVVFFCGAGVSCAAGLPDCRKLIEAVYSEIGEQRDEVETGALKRGQYDAALEHLAGRIPGQRRALVTAVHAALTPKVACCQVSKTHEALLVLARCKTGETRLVTTNFDRAFEAAAKEHDLSLTPYEAPFLPIPKKSRWDGLVYLHGRMPDNLADETKHRIVITSGDFGLAYLTERWAARFVTELFRHYVVCFVGYSISDTVLRYVTDALAADRTLGETPPQAYAFAPTRPRCEESTKAEWLSKGVTPILYRSPSRGNHKALHRTLQAWAHTFASGQRGKEQIVDQYASARPAASTQEDDYVGRMLWALSDPSGSPAARFADFNPVPPLEWLFALSKNRFGHCDLRRFGVVPESRIDASLAFSLLDRPAPYTLAPHMAMVPFGSDVVRWDTVMYHLARWLSRHLNDPQLLLWAADRGARVDLTACRVIEDALADYARAESDGDNDKLDEIRGNAPQAVPSRPMRLLWRMLLAGRVKTSATGDSWSRWVERLSADGVTEDVRFGLRAALSPKVHLRRKLGGGAIGRASVGTPADCVAWELRLAADGVSSWYDREAENAEWAGALPLLCYDLERVTRDAVVFRDELCEALETARNTAVELPSISPHAQNRHRLTEWVVLVEMLRDSWAAMLAREPVRARSIAQSWFDSPFPIFKRLALFAATKEGVTPRGEWVDWLIRDDGMWLWSLETMREVCRLLAERAVDLDDDARRRLEQAILKGPSGADQEQAERAMWLRLAKMVDGGAALGPKGEERLRDLGRKWSLAIDDSDEFVVHVTEVSGAALMAAMGTQPPPRQRRPLVKWLQSQGALDPFMEEAWQTLCRERTFAAGAALCDVAQSGQWLPDFWQSALEVWSDELFAERSWRYLAPRLRQVPNDALPKMAHGVALWLYKSAPYTDNHHDAFVELCTRLLSLENTETVSVAGRLTAAVNHPAGRATQALLRQFFESHPVDNQGLPAQVKSIFEGVCGSPSGHHEHAVVLLGANVIALYRVDPGWTVRYLIPLFDWDGAPNAAPAAWTGFLWSPRIYVPFLALLKRDLLNTAKHYSELEDLGRQYVAFLTHAALGRAELLTASEIRRALKSLPPVALDVAAQSMVQVLVGDDGQREKTWRSVIAPFWKRAWPKGAEYCSEAMTHHLARLAALAAGAFPEALAMVRDWLQVVQVPHDIVQLLMKHHLCKRHPQEALRMLDAVIGAESWTPPDLPMCLQAIKEAWPEAKADRRFVRLEKCRTSRC